MAGDGDGVLLLQARYVQKAWLNDKVTAGKVTAKEMQQGQGPRDLERPM